jgi:hypothetical protein
MVVMAGVIEMGRPRLVVDFAIVLRMRDSQNLGWSRMAEEYRRLSGEYISRDTIKRRYLEARKQLTDLGEETADESIS